MLLLLWQVFTHYTDLNYYHAYPSTRSLMKQPVSLLAIMLLVLGIIGCTHEGGNPINGGNNVLSITTTIAGVVIADNGYPAKGVVVTAHGRSVTTDEHGFYIIRDVSVPDDRCIVTVEKGGYFTASRAAVPTMGGVTHVHIGLLTRNVMYSIHALEGGTITLAEGGSIQMPIGGMDGYVPETPHLYMDHVKVAASRLFSQRNGMLPSFPLFSSGDLTGRRTDGSPAFLYSYGVMYMAMYTDQGEKLQFGNGKKAVLRYPIPPYMKKDAPAEMPMWHFDEKIGMWQEGGRAIKQGEEYVGEIAHTGQWNIAVPVPTATIKGQVKCGSDPVPFVNINIGQAEAWTDENGNYECRVPAGIPLEIHIESGKNLASGTLDEIVVEPLVEGQVLTRELIVGPCSAYLIGTIVGCDNKPVEGYVGAKVGGYINYTVSDSEGRFKLRTVPGTVTSMFVSDFDGRHRALLHMVTPAGAVKDLGAISLCPDNPRGFFNISPDTAYSAVSVSDDGNRVVAASKNNVNVFDVKTGQLLRSFSFKNCDHVQISSDNTKCLGSQNVGNQGGYQTTVWDIASGEPLLTFSGMHSFFMPDGRSVITTIPGSLGTTTVVISSISTGEEMRRFVLSTPVEAGYIDKSGSIINIVANGTRGVMRRIYGSGTRTMTYIVSFDIEAGTILTQWVALNKATSNIKVSDNGEILGMAIGNDPPLALFRIDGMSYQGMYAYAHSYYAISPDAKYFAFQRDNREPVGVYDITSSGPVLNRNLEVPEAATIKGLAYSLDGKTLAGLWQGGICIWQL